MTFKLLSWSEIVALGLAQGLQPRPVPFCLCHPSPILPNEAQSPASPFAGVKLSEWASVAREEKKGQNSTKNFS